MCGLRILEYSPDGGSFIVAGNAGPAAQPELVFYGRHTGWNGKFLWKGAGPRCLAFTHDSQMFITAAEDGKIQVWDALTFAGRSASQNPRFPDPLMTLHGLPQAISSLAISPDDTLLACGSVKGELTVRHWKPADTSPPQVVIEARREAAISSLCFSPDGAKLVVTRDSSTSSVDLWDISPGGHPAQFHRQSLFEGATANAQSSSFSSDGRFLAIGGKRSVMVWDRTRGLASELPNLPENESNQVTRVAYAKGNRPLLAIGFSDGTLSIWEDSCELARIHAHDKRISGLAFTPDGLNLTTAADDGGLIRFWNLSSLLTYQPRLQSARLTQ